MANTSTLYRFRIDLSNIDRSVYEALDFRIAMHPSEAEVFLLTRVVAYALRYQDRLQFSSGGLSNPDEPALSRLGENGQIEEWIEIGNPAARRLHKAAKAAGSVHVFTYKGAAKLKAELAGETIHHAPEIRIIGIPSSFLDRLAKLLARDNRWAIVFQEGELTVNVGEESLSTPLEFLSLE